MIIGPGATVTTVLLDAARQLSAADIENAAREARLLVAMATGLSQASLIADPDQVLAADAAARLAALVERRKAHEPMSHLIGRRGFWTLEVEVGPAVLDPRPDSETLIEAALDLFPDETAPLSVLDLGTGTGCLLLSVLGERQQAWGVGVDRSPDALAVAARNAVTAGVETRARFICGDWGQGVDGVFDLILCNPPYIRSESIMGLAPEIVNFEPRLALDGGLSGFDCYRAIAPDIARLLAADGVAVVEAGAGQMEEIAVLFGAADLVLQEVRRDLGGVERAGVFAANRR